MAVFVEVSGLVCVPYSGFLPASVDAILIAISITVAKLPAHLRQCHRGMPLVCSGYGY
jgi:hypothetical protein